jgi:hypothetical protein
MKAALDELLEGLDIQNPEWTPPPAGAIVFTLLCEKAPADQNETLIKIVLQTICSGLPDLILSAMFVSIAKGTLWADKSFALPEQGPGGEIFIRCLTDPRFSKEGAWIGGPPHETKASPEMN